jgi:hypothetical protein
LLSYFQAKVVETDFLGAEMAKNRVEIFYANQKTTLL